MWELSSDNGTTYTSLGIKAEGTDGTTPQIRINSTTFDWELSIDGGLKWIDMNVAAKQAVSGAEVVQVTGQETGKVMSQKAVTDAIAGASVDITQLYRTLNGLNYWAWREAGSNKIIKTIVSTNLTSMASKFSNKFQAKGLSKFESLTDKFNAGTLDDDYLLIR
jgi:hypothetical protein